MGTCVGAVPSGAFLAGGLHAVAEAAVDQGGIGRSCGNEFDAGYCYLGIVSEAFRRGAAVGLGADPKASDLLALPADQCLPLEALRGVAVQPSPGAAWHVGRGDYSFFDFGVAVAVREGLAFYHGSLGAELARNPLGKISVTAVLGARVGLRHGPELLRGFPAPRSYVRASDSYLTFDPRRGVSSRFSPPVRSSPTAYAFHAGQVGEALGPELPARWSERPLSGELEVGRPVVVDLARQDGYCYTQLAVGPEAVESLQSRLGSGPTFRRLFSEPAAEFKSAAELGRLGMVQWGEGRCHVVVHPLERTALGALQLVARRVGGSSFPVGTFGDYLLSVDDHACGDPVSMSWTPEYVCGGSSESRPGLPENQEPASVLQGVSFTAERVESAIVTPLTDPYGCRFGKVQRLLSRPLVDGIAQFCLQPAEGCTMVVVLVPPGVHCGWIGADGKCIEPSTSTRWLVSESGWFKVESTVIASAAFFALHMTKADYEHGLSYLVDCPC